MKSTTEQDKRISRVLEQETEEQATNLHKYIDEIKQLRRSNKQELRKKEKEITKLEDKWKHKMEEKEHEIETIKAKFCRDYDEQRRRFGQVESHLKEMEKQISNPQVKIQKERLAKLLCNSEIAEMSEVQLYKHLYLYIYDRIKPRERSHSTQRSRSRSRRPSMPAVRHGERSGSLAESVFEDSSRQPCIQEGVHVRLISRNKKYNGRIGVVVGCCFENRWPVKLGSGEATKVVKVLDRNLEIHAPPRRARSRSKSNFRASASRSLAALRPGLRNCLNTPDKKARASVIPVNDPSEEKESFAQGSPPEKLSSPSAKEKYFAVGTKIVALSRITKCWYPAKVVARNGESYRIAWESGDPTDTSKTVHEIQRRPDDGANVDFDVELETLRQQMQKFSTSMVNFASSPTGV
eukprot:TRINITY_DN697_c0_g1_i1.p1 TRINITY_DN697_c0_g1~~TRINITY_DN697_c0_g1_i1.p1  ORF type:complete len:408 (+),score=61.76 TRINITY_DN697_c0_g1_i1:124-1347(+)